MKTRVEKKYVPISCDFHDLLLDRATKRWKVTIEYNEDGTTKSRDSRIIDVYTKAGEEFLQMENGEVIRLDMLIRVDGVVLPEDNTCGI